MEKKTFKLSIIKELYDAANTRNDVKKVLRESYEMNPREIDYVMELADAKGWKPEKYAINLNIVDDDNGTPFDEDLNIKEEYRPIPHQHTEDTLRIANGE